MATFVAVAAVALVDRAPQAGAATLYRCEADGRVTYSDVPCPSGRQSTIAGADGPSAADRATAARRLAADRAQMAQFDKQQARADEDDRKAAAQARKDRATAAHHGQVCAALARRAATAHDAFDLAGPSDQGKTRLKAQRADEERDAVCKRG
jgi:hypothetical protein